MSNPVHRAPCCAPPVSGAVQYVIVGTAVERVSGSFLQSSSRPLPPRIVSLDPFVILIIQHDTNDQLCAVRGRLSSEEPGDALEDAPKDALPPRLLCGLFIGAALELRYPDYFVIHW